MRTKKLFMAIAAAVVVMMLAGCNVHDPIYETVDPDQGTITDWNPEQGDSEIAD